MTDRDRFTKVTFSRFKAFDQFTFALREFNILVGPNNSGKSTILAAFRILAAAIRRAGARRPDVVRGPKGRALGYTIDLKSISVAEENLFYNYDDSEPATVRFTLSNGNELLLYFPEQGMCYLLPDAKGYEIESTRTFQRHFNCPISFVPILGPVEHNELLFESEAARMALFNYRAARNFRNIWHHYPEKFDLLRRHLTETWPGMDIERPKATLVEGKARLHMFCIEDRIPREIFWAGFGFQIWCQMLTHLLQASSASLFLIDEPDIYLHSDLQRQLLGILRGLGPDILIATHSTEIITEAEVDDIVLINKRRQTARRIQSQDQLADVFGALGSSLNPVLTQLAKTRRALFVEGKDFQILGKFARKLGATGVANRSEFAVIPVEGFSPDRIRSLKKGIELTLGVSVVAAAILDRDYRSDAECRAIKDECATFCSFVTIHGSKELENYLLVPDAIDRAAARRLVERAKRTGGHFERETKSASTIADAALDEFCRQQKSYVAAQYLSARRQFERANGSTISDATLNELTLRELEEKWPTLAVHLVPGKDALSFVNVTLQADLGVSVTTALIIDAMTVEEVPQEMKTLVADLVRFLQTKAARPEDDGS